VSIISVTYISVSRLPDSVADVEVAKLAAMARARNPLRNVTGALLFTGSSFAQTLEGPDHEIENLLDRIHSDHRHSNIEILHREQVSSREFTTWWMAYWGRTSFVEQFVSACRRDRAVSSPRSPEDLRELIKLFAIQRAFTGDILTAATPTRQKIGEASGAWALAS
jgi:hypothetical protein